MTPDLLHRLNALRAERRPVAVCTPLPDGASPQRLVTADEPAPPELADAVAARLRSGRSGIERVGDGEVFVAVHVPAPRLVLIGAVHISQALARMAVLCDFDVTIVDPRTAFATPERFAGLRLEAAWPDELDLALDPYTALAAVTHDPKIDDGPLAEALAAGCFYVGALGSRKTHGARVERLRPLLAADERVADSEAALARIDAPIGLDIGAATPAEIAVAVMGQVIAALRR